MLQTSLFSETAENDWMEDDWQTPKEIAELMGSLVGKADKKILDVGAGMGQISQYLPPRSYCVEKKLRRLQIGETRVSKCSWIWGDYLQWLPESDFDLIIGNVPFSQCLQFIGRSLGLLNPANPEARILFLMPIDFNCGVGKGELWKQLNCHIHHEYRIQRRVHYLDRDGKPQKGRQIYDAVFDIRPGKNPGAVSFLER